MDFKAPFYDEEEEDNLIRNGKTNERYPLTYEENNEIAKGLQKNKSIGPNRICYKITENGTQEIKQRIQKSTVQIQEKGNIAYRVKV